MNSFSTMSSRVPNVIPDNFKNGSRIVGLGDQITIYYSSKQPIVPYILTGLLSTEVVDGNLTGNFTSPNYSTTIFLNSDATSTSFTMTTSKRSISIQIMDGIYIVGVSGQLYSANPTFSMVGYIAYEGAGRTTYMNIYNNNPANQVILPGLNNISVTGMTTDNLGNFYFGVNNLGGAICKIDSGGVFSVYGYIAGTEIGSFVNGIVTDVSNNVYYFKGSYTGQFMKRVDVSLSVASITTTGLDWMSMCTNFSKRNLYVMDKANSRIITNAFGSTTLNGLSNSAIGNNHWYLNTIDYTNNIYFNTTSLSTASFFTHIASMPGTKSKMAIDSSNNFYICQANCIRRAINITGAVSLIAGIPVVAPNSITYNGFDPSGVACIENSVIAMNVDSYDDIYFIDSSNSSYNLKQISYPTTTNRNITVLKTFTSNDAPQDMFIRNNFVYIALKYGIVSYPLPKRVVPLSPNSLRILSITSNTATITFEPPAGYILFYLATVGSLSQRVIPGSQISGLSSLLPANVYTLSIVSINATGTSSQSTVSLLTVPAAPTIINSISTSDSIAVTFNPSTGASSYFATTTGIVLQPFNSGDYITGLNAGTSYTINILATNASGNSVASSVTKLTAPSPPTINSAISNTSNSITITFTAPTSATSYRAKAVSTIDSCSNVVALPAGTTINGLSSGTNYTIDVFAMNSGGNSVVSSSVNLITKPAAPTITNSTSTSDSIAVTFNPSTGASSYIATTTSGIVQRSFNSGDYITGLNVGTSYTINILATNASGNSVASSSLTRLTVPASPTGLTATATATSITASFTRSTSTVNSHTATAVPTSGETTIQTITSTDSSIILTGLISNMSYTINVLATNTGGNSIAATTILTTPSYTIAGGTKDLSIAGYTQYKFDTSGTLIIASTLSLSWTMSILCVGGGGGGGGGSGACGGGGGGEVIARSYNYSHASPTTTLNVTVGSGGRGGDWDNDIDTNTASNSGTGTSVKIGTTTILDASGGGAGGYNGPPLAARITGGSKNGTIVSGSLYSGGSGSNFAAGGGGGAGGNGQSGSGSGNGASGYKGGDGGIGSTVSHPGLPTATYGGGGGGGTINTTQRFGSGGSGGGGNGQHNVNLARNTSDPSHGGINTGGGGGGCAEDNGGAGGSGYCIISIQN